MRFLDPNGLVSLIGLLAQTGVTWIMTLIFALLLRPSGRPGFFVDWTRGLLCLAIGLTAVTARYYTPLLTDRWPELFFEGGAATQALLLVYQVFKCAAAVYFLRGALDHARVQVLRSARAFALPAAVAYAFVTAIASREVEHVLFWQSLLVVPASFLSGVVLWRLPAPRRDQGVRIAATSFQLMAALWVVYGVFTASRYLGMDLVSESESWAHVFLSHNSYFDLALFVALSAGMIVLLMLDLQRTSRAAQEAQARLELQLERGERLRALGSLVSGVAHDLNNPLTAVLGFSAELERDLVEGPHHPAARIVREQAERCRSIVQKLSSLVGDHPAARRTVDARELLERVARGLAPRIQARGLRLEIDAAVGTPALYADPYGLEEILDNLLDNAIDFSPPGGRIWLSVGVEGGAVAIRVRDEGPGVPEPLRARVFEPFFSSRPHGAGTGIGLSVARGIARAHAGTLTLEAADGRPGASFALMLPPSPDPAPAAGADRPAAHAPPQRPGRLALVVDDEALVRKVLRRWLLREGWQVEEAVDGGSAAELLRASGAGIDAVLCDLRMPGTSGFALHDQLQREAPELLARTIFITGDLASPEAEQFSRRCRRPIVRKPFDFSELRAELERLGPRSDGPPAPVRALAGAALAAAALLASCGGGAADPAAPDATLVARTTNGPALYAQHCALCHGAEGAGDGIVVLDRPARSFRDGGFSFGNTEEAIFRTITSGIGGTPMPGFAQVLDDAQRRAVARHVIALGPEQVPGPGAASVLAVGDRPVVVRGQFRPLVEGGPDFPRGLLVGNPDGLSYQYRADDVRLLAVRQGPFVDRTDWGERGGLPLEPLGRVIFLAEERGDPGPEWILADGAPLRARLIATRTAGGAATLEYALLDEGGAERARIQERCAALGYAAAAGFGRDLRVEPPEAPVRLRLLGLLENPLARDVSRILRAPSNDALGLLVRNGVLGARAASVAPEDGSIALEILLPPDGRPETWTAVEKEIGR